MKNKKVSIVSVLLAISVVVIVAILAIPGWVDARTSAAFENEFGFDRLTATPEIFVPVLRGHLDHLCTDYKFLQGWADEVWNDFFPESEDLLPKAALARREDYERRARAREEHVRTAREYYERARAMALDNGFIRYWHTDACHPVAAQQPGD